LQVLRKDDEQGPDVAPGCICSTANAQITEKDGVYFCVNCTRSWSPNSEKEKESVWTGLITNSNPSGETLSDFFHRAKLTENRRNMLERLKIGSTSGIPEVIG
jgi:hypothetical protein